MKYGDFLTFLLLDGKTGGIDGVSYTVNQYFSCTCECRGEDLNLHGVTPTST